MTRPACPVCAGPVDQMRRSAGVVAAYPCLHWLTPGQAKTATDRWRAARDRRTEP